MISIKFIKQNLNFVLNNLKKRNFIIDIDFIISKDNIRKSIQNKLENLRFKSNQFSNNFKLKKSKKNYINNLNFKNIRKKINKLKSDLNLIKVEIKNYLYTIPNIFDDNSIPIGNSNKNIVIYKWGNKKTFDFKISSYISIGKKLDCMDFKLSSNISGSKFVIMKNKIAKLNRSIIQFMLDIHINKHFYEEIYVPLIVNKESMYGSGQFPKFINDSFNIIYNSNNYYLIPTSEVPLINLFRNKILSEKQIPIKYVSYTPCFRTEFNSYGKNNCGLIKLNQFDKVELIRIVDQNSSKKHLEELTNDSEIILKLLNLHYRKILLSSNELPFTSYKTYDLEVWFPYKNKYIEVSSCSNTLDFQSRRILSRYRDKNNNILLTHIINGSGLAVSRILAAIIENYQNKNLDFDIPEVLKKYY
ncbi:serine--tRNA ligase [endosymbiont of Euscepes postfasciatus]|uniref:serine--tRNA ligase n=1 Tax=endosymbiont of Euscepes postfasciatus TaxID=650377 RepID=UPI000DC6FC84|nr:serine--tRNA ligase [endosymbiont of Euscepes postfasciatus]BBA84548.1 serine--tRNA ligase [endosymbiont of Euscepes postfasciatus]